MMLSFLLSLKVDAQSLAGLNSPAEKAILCFVGHLYPDNSWLLGSNVPGGIHPLWKKEGDSCSVHISNPIRVLWLTQGSLWQTLSSTILLWSLSKLSCVSWMKTRP